MYFSKKYVRIKIEIHKILGSSENTHRNWMKLMHVIPVNV